jgi:hypothetical protein
VKVVVILLLLSNMNIAIVTCVVVCRSVGSIHGNGNFCIRYELKMKEKSHRQSDQLEYEAIYYYKATTTTLRAISRYVWNITLSSTVSPTVD